MSWATHQDLLGKTWLAIWDETRGDVETVPEELIKWIGFTSDVEAERYAEVWHDAILEELRAEFVRNMMTVVNDD